MGLMNYWLIVHDTEAFNDGHKPDDSNTIGFEDTTYNVKNIESGDMIVYYLKSEHAIKGIYQVKPKPWAGIKTWDNDNQIDIEHITELLNPIDFTGLIPSLDLFKGLKKWTGAIQGKNAIRKLTGHDFTIIEAHIKKQGANIKKISKVRPKMVSKDGNGIQYPYEQDSWRIIAPDVFIKKMDKSTFLHHGTGIPADIRRFFDVTGLKYGEGKVVSLLHNQLLYNAYFSVDTQPNPRTRLFWHVDFTNLLKKELPSWFSFFENGGKTEDPPLLRFKKIELDMYQLQIIDPKAIEVDAEHEETDCEPVYEGTIKYYYSKVYERNPENRRRAIEIHGLQCLGCGFDFEQFYGDRGAGFIEIHHATPLSNIGEKIEINPATDLVPVCSNCHRIIHRDKQNVLTVEEVRRIIGKKREDNH